MIQSGHGLHKDTTKIST